jgi:U3 small nucleolar RNA-associated protein 23
MQIYVKLINKNIYIQPSQQSQLEAEKSKSTIELDRVRQIRKVELGEQQEKRHKKRKAKGPNPLSCKKKRPKTDDSGQSAFGKTTNKGSAKEISQEEEADSKQEEKKPMSAAEKAKKRRIRRRLMENGQTMATAVNRPHLIKS